MLTRGCLQNQMALQTTIVEAVIMVVGFISIFLHISTWGKLIIFPGASSMVPDLGIPVCDSGSAGEDCRASGPGDEYGHLAWRYGKVMKIMEMVCTSLKPLV